MVSVAGSDLLRTVREGDSEASATSKVLVDLRQRLSDVEQAQRNRMHDARSAIMGVLAASEMLLQAGERGPADTSRLNQLMARELRRLQSVLDSETVEPIAQFDLAEALNSVVTIHQLDGSTISVQLRSLPVIGRPRATATVLDNLLRNARVHAPGSNVTVRAEQVGAVATVVVEDDGPGIPPSEYEQVLRPGVRGSSAAVPGSGLGLSNAVDAMRRQGGALNVSGRVGGGTRVTLTLPIALTGPDTRALAS
jgi:signal transduction histidine kinase